MSFHIMGINQKYRLILCKSLYPRQENIMKNDLFGLVSLIAIFMILVMLAMYLKSEC